MTENAIGKIVVDLAIHLHRALSEADWLETWICPQFWR